jgi:hypothetical protein
MGAVTAVLAALLRRAGRFLPAGRREWGEAVWAEAGGVPAGRARLWWLAGGLWLVARQAPVVRRIGSAAAAATAGAVLVWLDWHPGSANPAMATNRAADILLVALLAVLPWVARAGLGPVAGTRAARVARAGGYLAVYALLLVVVGMSRFAGSRFDHFHAFDQAYWEAAMRHEAVVGAVLWITLLCGYAATVLAVTARRTSVPPATLAAGAGLGAAAALIGYALMPLGNTMNPHSGWQATAYHAVVGLVWPVLLGAPLAAGWLAAHRAAATAADRNPVRPAGVLDPVEAASARRRQGTLAGLLAGGTAALGLAILTVGTMLLFPRHVDLKWANPDPNVPHGTTYEIQMSLSDTAGKYQIGLLLGPLLGLVLGALGGDAATGEPEPPPHTRRT